MPGCQGHEGFAGFCLEEVQGFSIFLSFPCLLASCPWGILALVGLGTLKMIPKYRTECKISLCHQEFLGSALWGAYVCPRVLTQSLQLAETCVTNQILVCVDGVEPEASGELHSSSSPPGNLWQPMLVSQPGVKTARRQANHPTVRQGDHLLPVATDIPQKKIRWTRWPEAPCSLEC